MPTDRATARAEIARRDLTETAVERVLRVALFTLPVSLVGRAATQLQRFFSGESWAAEDDSSLAAVVGPGTGWYDEVLDPEVTIGFGWRAGAFRAEARYTPADPGTTGPDPGGAASAAIDALDIRQRTLGDTFEDTIVLEASRNPTEMYFRIGPVVGPNATLTRDNTGGDRRVASLFDACPEVVQIAFGAGTLTATIDDASHWPDTLLTLFDTITAEFAPPRAAPPDRQLERARSELGTLRPDNPRDLARIVDATTSPDVAYRRIAMERLLGADAAAALRPWTRGLEDSSRAVRRVTARVLADSADPDTRQILERALSDGDACVRYYAVRGLVAIGLESSLPAIHQRRNDPDVRVRLALEAALDGRVPA